MLRNTWNKDECCAGLGDSPDAKTIAACCCSQIRKWLHSPQTSELSGPSSHSVTPLNVVRFFPCHPALMLRISLELRVSCPSALSSHNITAMFTCLPALYYAQTPRYASDRTATIHKHWDGWLNCFHMSWNIHTKRRFHIYRYEQWRTILHLLSLPHVHIFYPLPRTLVAYTRIYFDWRSASFDHLRIFFY